MSKVIIFPTDTVYGIGCPIFDVEGIEKIYSIKHRSKEKPLACLCANTSQIESIAIVDEVAKKLIHHFLPGALTIILEARKNVVDRIGYTSIGVRIPNCEKAIQILSENGPMLTTSVNESGEVALNSYNEILKAYGDKVDKIYPPTSGSSSIASTVISIIRGKIEVIREGAITFEMIQSIINV